MVKWQPIGAISCTVDEKRAIDEMKHAEMLIERILFLEGQPIVSELKAIHIGEDVEKQIRMIGGQNSMPSKRIMQP